MNENHLEYSRGPEQNLTHLAARPLLPRLSFTWPRGGAGDPHFRPFILLRLTEVVTSNQVSPELQNPAYKLRNLGPPVGPPCHSRPVGCTSVLTP